MWAWLNPANLIKILSLLKSLWDAAVTIYERWQEARKKAEQDKIREDNLKRYEDAVKKGDKDEIAQAGEDLLNGRRP